MAEDAIDESAAAAVRLLGSAGHVALEALELERAPLGDEHLESCLLVQRPDAFGKSAPAIDRCLVVGPADGIDRDDDAARLAHPCEVSHPNPGFSHVFDDLAREHDIV